MQQHIAAMIGRELAGYRLERVVGVGGTGVVFLGRPVAGDGERSVAAIKILIAPWQTTERDRAVFRARYQREIDVLQRLHHPHIIPILAWGDLDGEPYLVMPLFMGGSLAARIARTGPFPLDQVADILDQLAGALDYAHALGVIHRDLKPGNILFDAQGQACLADFGIMRQYDDAAASLTATGQIVGTPMYMAPEQINGRPVGSAADRYSLGLIAYEMVTGRAAFSAANPYDVMMLQVQEPPPAPSQYRPELPLAAERVILRALAKAAGDRYPTAAAFVQAFRAALAALEEEARGASARSTAISPLPDAPVVASPLASTRLVSAPGTASVADGRTSGTPLWRAALALCLVALVISGGLIMFLRHDLPLGQPAPNPLRVAGAVSPTSTPMQLPSPTATATVAPSATPTPSPLPTTTPVPGAPIPGPGLQLLVNPSFEGYAGWCVWNNDRDQLAGCDGPTYHYYEEAYVKPVDGATYGVQYSASESYDVSTFQAFGAPADGYYFVSLYVWTTCGSYNYLFIKDATNGAVSAANVVSCLNGWTYVTGGPLFVMRGHYVAIEIRSRNGPGQYYRFDRAFMCYMTAPAACV